MLGLSLALLRAGCALAENRAREDADPLRRDGARRQFDDERGGAGERVVLPAGDAPGIACELLAAHSDEPREAPLHAHVAAGLVDDVQVLVEPDRDCRADAADQVVGDAALALRERTRARVEGPAERLPEIREVAVKVDAARVLPRVGSNAVRVQ